MATEIASPSTATVVPLPEFQVEKIAAATVEITALPIAAAPASPAPEQLDFLAPIPLSTSQQYVFQTGSLASSLAEPLVDMRRSDSVASDSVASDSTEDVLLDSVRLSEASSSANSGSAAENIQSDLAHVSDSVQTLPEFESFNSHSADLGEALFVDQQPIAQAETPAEASPVEPEPEETSPRWRFAFAPYAFVPFSVEGDATVRNFTADIDLGLDDILNPLNFALAGRVEAWRGNLGLIFDGSYFSLSQDSTRTLPIPNCLCNIFPSEITADVKLQYGQFDLGVGYRIAENVNQADSDFDLGPLAFDAIVGIRIYALRQEIEVSTNLDTSRDFEGSATLVQPLVSGRLRWNLSPKLAGWVRGDLAGLGLGGTLLAASVTGGFDWVFAGDTSLLLAYRLSSLQYNTDVGGENLELNLLFHGPYVGVVFRF
ncbi:MAG: hypothetical protein ACKO7W_12290 [Elainella sp.]